MARIPPQKRLIAEDFPEQKAWIGKLVQPLNGFMEATINALNRRLTLVDNMAADLKYVLLDSVPTKALPAKIAWSLQAKPAAIIVASIQYQDGSTLILSQAVQVQWQFTDALSLTNIVGITPTASKKVIVTLVIFTG